MTERDAANTGDLAPGGASAQPFAASHDRDDALRQIAERLRVGREGQRLTIEDLATRLKVAPAKLLAVESGDISVLPDMTFAKGLIRTYARVLQVDVDDQLARLAERAQAANIGLRPEGGLGKSFTDKPSFAARRSGSRWLIGALVAVVVIGGALAGMDRLKQWLASHVPETAQTPAEQAAKAAPKAEPGPAAAGAQVSPAPAVTTSPAQAPAASMPTPLTPARARRAGFRHRDGAAGPAADAAAFGHRGFGRTRCCGGSRQAGHRRCRRQRTVGAVLGGLVVRDQGQVG